MEEKKPFEKLLTRNVYAILDGDTTFGEYKSVGGKTVITGLPYLSGPALCELSTTFGYPVQYNWNGSNQSRWSYVEDILKHCIKNDTCSRLLEYMFSFSRFENAFHGLERNEMDSAYKRCVQKTIEGINSILIFSNSALVFRDKRFQIVSSERQYNSEESLSEILGEHKEDPFSSITEYERCESVGRGGFGEVYRYHNQNLNMDFAVKIYRPWFVSDTEREEGEKRFFREAKTMSFSLAKCK